MNYERDEILWNGKKTHFNSTSTSLSISLSLSLAKIDHADLQSEFFTFPIYFDSLSWFEIFLFIFYTHLRQLNKQYQQLLTQKIYAAFPVHVLCSLSKWDHVEKSIGSLTSLYYLSFQFIQKLKNNDDKRVTEGSYNKRREVPLLDFLLIIHLKKYHQYRFLISFKRKWGKLERLFFKGKGCHTT